MDKFLNRFKRLNKSGTHTQESLLITRNLVIYFLRGCSHCYNRRNVHSSWPESFFVRTTWEKWSPGSGRVDIGTANTFWTINFMTRKRKAAYQWGNLFQVDFSKELNKITVKMDVLLFAKTNDILNG